ncbi:Tripartite ATP-independent periplasmic transporter, DctQ component [Psychromonas ingrahamii 37]|uniref:TRAP transporter small permease protein n=1 Tax=Psychromonas ingrahamii (strain DSM 17664 / CCUG 51855 / 37) TaxID=357804 RepID=A1T0U0_PSYIN|nr:TRAP transporter small permease subunit [Psychromonas ingrahamii]ABM05355.1 Tripartite ATP-independent periplasmic transporter, DctQ component [Psychromonas ingrahamii 37]
MTVHSTINSSNSSDSSDISPSNDKERPFFLKITSWLSTISGWCSASMTLAAVFITCQMIFVRFVLNGSTTWQTEAIIYLILGATLIGLPFVQQVRGHVNVDLIPLMLPSRARYYLAIFTLTLSAVVIGTMFWYSFEYWHLLFSRGWTTDSVWAVRLWIPHSSMIIGFGLLFLQLVADLVAVLLKIDKPFGLGEN